MYVSTDSLIRYAQPLCISKCRACAQSKTGIWNSVGHRALQKRGTLILINNFYKKKKITLEREPENSLTTTKKRPQKPLILPFVALEACGSGAKRCTSNPISIKPLFQYRAIGLSSLSEPYKCSDLLALLHMFVSARRDFYRTRVQGCCKFMGWLSRSFHCSIEQTPHSLQANPPQDLPNEKKLKMRTVKQAFGFVISTYAFPMSWQAVEVTLNVLLMLKAF